VLLGQPIEVRRAPVGPVPPAGGVDEGAGLLVPRVGPDAGQAGAGWADEDRAQDADLVVRAPAAPPDLLQRLVERRLGSGRQPGLNEVLGQLADE
jgi:hypothetical protein